MPTNCANASTAAYQPTAQNPWDTQKAVHLYRRATLGADVVTIKNALGKNPIDVVNAIVDKAAALPTTAQPSWANWKLSDYSSDEQTRTAQISGQYIEWGKQWVYDMKTNGLRDRMSWFWHNHFVTRLEKYICPSWLYNYQHLLQKHALGNFKEFVKEIGLCPAMLVFLDGVQNTRFQINENYGRELYEIFTLGVDNGYTQQDIVETARALTGWNGLDVNNLCGEVTFNPLFFDPGQKTIFGKKGAWAYKDVIDILFQERGVKISEYISRKIYKSFVNPDVNETVVKELATIFRNNNFELVPLMKAMLSSEHFFDVATFSTIIPGHIEYFMTFIKEMNYKNDDQINLLLAYSGEDFDQRMFNPTDVSGWPGNRSWITSASYPYRVEGIQNIIGYYFITNQNDLEPLRKYAIDIVGENQIDPLVITKTIINQMLPKGLQNESDYLDAFIVFKADVPDNYFASGQWNLNWEYAPVQVYLLLIHIANLPEFQLR